MRIAVSGSLLVAAALAWGVCMPATAQTTAPAATAKPAAPKYSTTDTDIGTLLDDPAAKAIIEKHIPGMTTNPQIDMARSMTLKSIQAYAASDVTDERLAAIDADLAKLGS